MPLTHPHLCLLSALILIATAQAAVACSCGRVPTVLEEFDQADEVVVVKALSVETAPSSKSGESGPRVQSTTFEIERAFKGNFKVHDQFVLGQGGSGNCFLSFNEKIVGARMLFYLKTPKTIETGSNLWFVNSCSRFSNVESATEDLRYLENMSQRRGQTRISGTLDSRLNVNLEGSIVRITGSNNTHKLKTDKHGVFEIYDLPPGKYLLDLELPAGWKIGRYGLRYSSNIKKDLRTDQIVITLQSGKHASFEAIIDIDNMVRGRVFGPGGKPVRQVGVHLADSSSKDHFEYTDEDGRFNLTSIRPGEYVIVVNKDGQLTNPEPFHTRYYPGVTDRRRATVFTIKPGTVINNLRIVIPKFEDTVTISGVFLYADGTPVRDEYVQFIDLNKNDKVNGDDEYETDYRGRFQLDVLKGLTLEVFGEVLISKDYDKNCPKIDELLAKSGTDELQVKSNVVKLKTEKNVYRVELRLPFPKCRH